MRVLDTARQSPQSGTRRLYPRGVPRSNVLTGLVAALACAGALAFTGCGGSSSSGNTATTLEEGAASLNPTLSRRETIEKEEQAQAEREKFAKEKGITTSEGGEG